MPIGYFESTYSDVILLYFVQALIYSFRRCIPTNKIQEKYSYDTFTKKKLHSQIDIDNVKNNRVITIF